MALKTINKKGSTLTTLVIAMLLVIGIFSGYYLFFVEQMDNYDTTLDEKYNETYQTLLETQEAIDNNVTTIRNRITEVEEADNTFLAAIAGFKGLGAALLLLVTFVSSGVNVFTAIFFSTDIIPSDVQNLMLIGVIAFIILLIIAILKGEGKM
jgi:hypothetical protein